MLRLELGIRGLAAVVVRDAVAGAPVEIGPKVRIRGHLVHRRRDTLQVPRVSREQALLDVMAGPSGRDFLEGYWHNGADVGWAHEHPMLKALCARMQNAFLMLIGFRRVASPEWC